MSDDNIIVSQRSVHKGRGALSNRGSRYQPTAVEWDDGITGPTAQIADHWKYAGGWP